MKKNKNLTSKIVFAVVIFFFALATGPVNSQGISFDDDVDDEIPAAPIDGLLGLGLVAGAYYGYRKLKGKV